MTPTFALLDAPDGGASLFETLQREIAAASAATLDAACAEAEAAAAAGAHVVAAIDYEFGTALVAAADAPAAGSARFWVFARRSELDAAALARWLAAQAGDPPRAAALVDFAPELDAAAHADGVARIRDYIAAGDCYQVNFTFFFAGRCAGDPLALYARLRQSQPVACGGLIAGPGGAVLSLSPELFIERHDGVIESRPMKGTAPRGADPAQDAAAIVALAASPKDRAENVMIVDLIRNDLGRIAEIGSVAVAGLCAVETYPSLHQMVSRVAARSDAGVADVLRAMFPCGSITGAPKRRAMQIIRELERGPRGLYTGALGWVGRGGDFRFNVAIRTLEIDAGGGARMGVGSGIVWDSDAAAEYRECLCKARFAQGGDPGFRLIETVRLEDGATPLWALHRQRLQDSAAAFGFACDMAQLEEVRRLAAAAHAQGLWRLRLSLGHAGDIDIGIAALTPTPPGLRCVVSPWRIDSRDAWRAHKTTERTRYDAELQRVTADAGVFDAIFLNEREEVCEGARSNVFVRAAPDAPLLTPPLACGLLPGVLRAQLLARGEAVERRLTLADLRGAAELYLGNALRGLVPVRLEE